MIKIINEIIGCFFYRDSDGMKFSSSRMVLFIAKCKITIPIFIWGLAIVGFFERYILKSHFFTQLPNSRIIAALIVLLIYFPLNKITWNLTEVSNFVSDEENMTIIKQRFIQYFIITGIGVVFLLYVGYQNKWHPLP